jgi:hypothetical protein
MSRLRLTFMTAAMLLALAALTLNSLAQPPGGGGGGGGRGGFGGPGGGFGGPGGGFGGPGGGSLLQLASNPAVQEDLKLKDAQKTKIKSLSDKYNAQMQELRTQMGMGGPGGPGGGPGGAQGKGQGRRGNGGQGGGGGGGGAGGGGGGGGGQGQDPNAQAGGGGGRGNRGNRNQNGQNGVQEDPAVVAQRNEQRAMAREAMNELRQNSESALAKLLDRNQVARLKQISLQLEGNQAVLCQNETHPHGDMIDKLQIDEAQYAMIQETLTEGRNAERASRKSRGEAMKNAFARLNPNGANGGQNNGGNGNGGAGAGGAGNNGNGNNGRNGGGRGGRGNFDPEAMRKLMESPEMKAQMEEFQGQEEKLTAQLTNAIFKVLSPRQRTTFKKMLGVPFDRTKMFAGGPWGGRGGAAAGKNQGSTTSKGAATADDDDDEDAPKAKPSTTAAPVKAKSSAVAKKKSLRELRGDPSDDN